MAQMDSWAQSPSPPSGGISPHFMALLSAFLGTGAALGIGVLLPVPGVLLFVLAGWIVSLCLHEFGHAIVAHWGGDHSIQGRGYLTLNPLKYTHPIWSIAVPLLFLLLGGIGFPGGAVFVRPGLIRTPIMRSLMSLAGPIMSLVAGLAFAGVYWLAVQTGRTAQGTPDDFLWQAVGLLAFLQFTAVIFNMLPFPGLDGFGVIQPFIPASLLQAIMPIARLLPLVVIATVLLTPGIFAPLLDPAFAAAAWFGIDPFDIVSGLSWVQFWQ